MKNIYIIAGSNGAGKTTFAKKFLPDYAKCQNFINTDFIAQGLSPFSPRSAAIKAGKIVLEQIYEFMQRGIDFSFETTLSGRLYIKLFKKFRKKGYKIHLFFLWIPDVSLALKRIKDRVADGGHNVPVEDVQRRFKRSLDNFFRLYQPLVDTWMIFNNSGLVPTLIAKKNNGDVIIVDKKLFEKTKEVKYES